MLLRISKWGNSTGVRISKRELRRQGLEEGQVVEVELRPVEPCYTMEQLLEIGDLPGRDGEDFDWGAPMGREIW